MEPIIQNTSSVEQVLWYNDTIGDVPIIAILLILLAVIIILILSILLISNVSKNKKHLTFNLFNKRCNKKESISTAPSRSLKKKEDVKKQILLSIQNHKFFSYIKFKYVGVDYNLSFETYEMLIAHGIKVESKELQEFKKLIASRFLSDCIFKYLFESVKKWIDDIVREYDASTDEKNFVPITLCDIIEDLVHFTKETTRMSSQVRLTFDNHLIDGIPPDFVKYFCKIVNRDMKTIQEVMSSIIYVTDVSWYNKIIEILDILELVLVYIKDSVDATLVVLNGQLEKYLEELNKETENGSI